MCNISRQSKSEYIAEKRRVYDKAGKAKRFHMLNEVCETLDRAFMGLPRERPLAVKSNSRTGFNKPILDTVAYCGGDMRKEPTKTSTMQASRLRKAPFSLLCDGPCEVLSWCTWWDLNPHALRHWNLNPACLPFHHRCV